MKTEDEGVGAWLAERVLRRVLAMGIDGFGPFESARAVASNALAERPNPQMAVESIVQTHMRLAALNGFVTGLGGLITMVVALPTNVVGFSMLSARMTAAIAVIRGHDVDDPATRTAVLLTLTGNNAAELLAKAGVVVPGGRVAGLALRHLPSSTLSFINKGIAFRLLTRVLGRGVVRFGRLVPLVGGVIGALIDRLLLRSIARTAIEELSPPT